MLPCRLLVQEKGHEYKNRRKETKLLGNGPDGGVAQWTPFQPQEQETRVRIPPGYKVFRKNHSNAVVYDWPYKNNLCVDLSNKGFGTKNIFFKNSSENTFKRLPSPAKHYGLFTRKFSVQVRKKLLFGRAIRLWSHDRQTDFRVNRPEDRTASDRKFVTYYKCTKVIQIKRLLGINRSYCQQWRKIAKKWKSWHPSPANSFAGA
jgi:hypothetical protein